jgi:hypothetical protein
LLTYIPIHALSVRKHHLLSLCIHTSRTGCKYTLHHALCVSICTTFTMRMYVRLLHQALPVSIYPIPRTVCKYISYTITLKQDRQRQTENKEKQMYTKYNKYMTLKYIYIYIYILKCMQDLRNLVYIFIKLLEGSSPMTSKVMYRVSEK